MGQYVGARYVPDVTGTTYDPTQAYENLVVVDNGMGTSYISRKPVPAGTPLTNTEYWAIYGASNGAIINLQNQIGNLDDLNTTDKDSLVDAINENVSEMQDLANRTTLAPTRKFICIGDSYMKAVGLTSDKSYVRRCLNSCGYTENTDYFVSCEDGYGFARTGMKFLSLLQSISIGSLNASDITDIIVGGGANDSGNIGDISTAISEFVAYANTAYPNAEIHLAFTDWAMGAGFIYSQMIEQWKLGAYNNKIHFIDKMWLSQHTYSLKQSDGHPNDNGQIELAKALKSYLINGVVSTPIYTKIQSDFDADKDCTFNVSYGNSSLNDIMCGLYLGSITWTLNTPVTTYEAGATSNIEVATITSGCFAGCSDSVPHIETPCIIVDSSNNKHLGICDFSVYGSVLQARLVVDSAMTITSFATRPCALIADAFHS